MLVRCNGLLNRPGEISGVGSIPMSSACSNARRDYILEKCVGRKAKLFSSLFVEQIWPCTQTYGKATCFKNK